jgi:septal ring factor EnvC (AmiA/AmiB activator)
MTGRRRAFLWGAGSTVLSAVGLIGLALFEQYNGLISELRGDLKHFNEASAQLAQKEEVRRVRDQMKELNRDVSMTAADRARLEQELRSSEQSRAEQARELQRLRERVAYLEGLHGARPGPAASVAGPATEPADR